MTRWFRRGAHGRRRWGAPAAEGRLRSLSSHIPELSPEEFEPLAFEEPRHPLRRALVALIAAGVIILAGLQWFRPVPAPVFHSSLTTVRLPGSPPVLPWPTMGSAALSVSGAGSLGQSGNGGEVPISGLAKVMTALVVLDDHPISVGSSGPTIPVSAADVATYQTDLASQQTVVPVTVGEDLNETQALEGLLVASGNNLATLLADWDAVSTANFVAKMNATAHRLGLTSTTFADPSGESAGSVSTPAQLIQLAEAAMAIPTFSQIVAMPQVTLPVGGTEYNLDTDLGRDGFVGIKTGSGTASGGCFLFAASKSVFGKKFELVGVVLGQQAVPQTATAVHQADALVSAALADLAPFQPLAPGLDVGQIHSSWGSSTPVTPSSTASLLGWSGLSVAVRLRARPPPVELAEGAPVGVATITFGTQHLAVDLRTKMALAGPSIFWRLTRH